MLLNLEKKAGTSRKLKLFLKRLISPGSAQEPGLIAHDARQPEFSGPIATGRALTRG